MSAEGNTMCHKIIKMRIMMSLYKLMIYKHSKFAHCIFVLQKGAPVSACGFFKHPLDSNYAMILYGDSPDGIGEAFSVDVKTRAENSEGP